MKSRPILFSGEMVRAILDGRKTQTRRIIKNLKIKLRHEVHSDAIFGLIHKPMVATAGIHRGYIAHAGAVSVFCDEERRLGVKPEEFDFVCPYADGKTVLVNLGDRKSRWEVIPQESQLWVKETFAPSFADDDDSKNGWVYRATNNGPEPLKWKPSIFMPRAASRITLELTAVRAERLNDISSRDAQCEGVTTAMAEPSVSEDAIAWSYIDGYQWLWESINGKGSWEKNPWVWVLEFKVIAK